MIYKLLIIGLHRCTILIPLCFAGKDPTDQYLDGMMQEAPGPINFTMFLTMFGEKLNGTDPEDVIKNAFGCFDEDNTGKFFFNFFLINSFIFMYIYTYFFTTVRCSFGAADLGSKKKLLSHVIIACSNYAQTIKYRISIESRFHT